MRIATTIGEDLREEPEDDEKLRRAIASEREDLAAVRDTLAAEPNELDRTRLARVLQRLGEHLRLEGTYEEAGRCCEEAAAIWKDFGRERAAFLARLRRASVDFHRGALGDALRRSDALVAAAESEPFRIYRDFALELRGRIRVVRGEDREGLRDLRAALELRRDRGRDRLVDRTERILELAGDESP